MENILKPVRLIDVMAAQNKFLTAFDAEKVLKETSILLRILLKQKKNILNLLKSITKYMEKIRLA